MRINEDGSVGIGTSLTSGNKLAGEGSIAAKKMIVTQRSWADLVFDNNYKLKTLPHVGEFIKVNRHLPDVQFASDIKTHGLDLGDTQAILLRRIEELTLYIIFQDKAIKSLNKLVANQKKELFNQEQRLAVLEKLMGITPK